MSSPVVPDTSRTRDVCVRDSATAPSTSAIAASLWPERRALASLSPASRSRTPAAYAAANGLSIEEAARFLEDLMQGRILSKEYLTQMKTWNDDKNPDYGYGLMADKGFPYKFLMGHSGRGIGTTADVYYFPKQDISIAIFCNSGLRAASPEFAKVYNKMRKKIIKKLFLF